MPIPKEFSSLYRLVLRASSAAVLHHPASVINLRHIYRATFSDAAKVIHQLHQEKDTANQQALQRWLQGWDKQMDNTLSMLYTSSQSRGLSHNVTAALSQIAARQYLLLGETLPKWNGQNKPDHAGYRIQPLKQRKAEEAALKQAVDKQAFVALGRVLRMAEGRSGLAFGRAIIKGRVRRPRRESA